MREASIMLLATYHMNNPRRDMYNPDVDDVLSARRQGELQRMAEELLRFKPTVVAVEVEPAQQDELDQDFRDYVAGRFDLMSDERHQVGFRVAALAGLPRVHAINWNEDEGYGGWSLADVYEWAREHDPDGYRQLTSTGQSLVEEFDARQTRSTIAQMHAWFNEPATLAELHAPYMAMAAMGDLPHAAGTEWVAGWYNRNLRIYFNLARILQRGDRALVVYGAGHIPLLSHFTTSGGRFVLEDVRSRPRAECRRLTM